MTTGKNSRKGKLATDGNRQPQTDVKKKRPFTENCQPLAPSNGGERKKNRKLTCHVRPRMVVAKKQRKIYEWKIEKKLRKKFYGENPSGHLYVESSVAAVAKGGKKKGQGQP